jgi:hypothetical protein
VEHFLKKPFTTRLWSALYKLMLSVLQPSSASRDDPVGRDIRAGGRFIDPLATDSHE